MFMLFDDILQIWNNALLKSSIIAIYGLSHQFSHLVSNQTHCFFTHDLSQNLQKDTEMHDYMTCSILK